ncbi:uncharacterized protein Z519_02899 [Cladophialophora bantiana CBS 173.52]|uniref:FAD-binding domain-containing protein n=1 Tax=Cladophialophora bantiana (strain ATCC 10958 / CBS 173.52 / CDC B-1940 / NIH 8579) TaxID=1442370 RepID=A0A0D2HY22_CLAB1|nr:uncharacterized protein Z519_02899 [Cladophialophora bantiana CBS 173.52]KIW95835.1 hypothetical protein Z519_02899 [Cladophialophora bantiana CBS 173.52]
MASGTPQLFNVIVIGAGSTGLLLAQGLKQNGIPCTVYEREDHTTYQNRSREWGMTLHWGAEYLSKCIPPDLVASINDNICCDPFFKGKVTSLPIYNGATGDKLFEMEGMDPRRVSRKKLRNFLSQGIDVQYGKRLASVTVDTDAGDSVTAFFEDGTRASGSLLVGCDGAHSTVRRFLVGEELAKEEIMDIQMFNVSCAFPREIAEYLRSIHPIFKHSYHPDNFTWWNSIQDVTDPDKPETWLFQNLLSWPGSPRPEDLPDQASRLRFWRDRISRYAEPWATIGKHLPEDLVFPTDRTVVWKPDMDWSSSPLWPRVTLAGDAAHAIPPFRGQGLNNALQDAAKLIDELSAVPAGSKTLSEAVSEYEKEMKERALLEMKVSVLQAETVHNWARLMEAPFIKHGMNKYKEEKQEQEEKTEQEAN